MKKQKLWALIPVAVLLLGLSACSSKGGTLTLINDTSYILYNCEISLGKTKKDVLLPGEWMQASNDKNVIANVQFTFSDYYINIFKKEETENPEDFVEIAEYGGLAGKYTGRFTSYGISVQNGESVLVTIRNKQPPEPESGI